MVPTDNSNGTMDHYAVYCPYCRSSDIVLKEKVLTKNRGPLQRYECKQCEHKFRWGAFLHNKYGNTSVERVLDLSARPRGKPARWLAEWKKRGIISSYADEVLQGLVALREKIVEQDLKVAKLQDMEAEP